MLQTGINELTLKIRGEGFSVGRRNECGNMDTGHIDVAEGGR